MIQKHTPPLEEILVRTASDLRSLLPSRPSWALVPGTGTKEFLEVLEEVTPLPAADSAPAWFHGELHSGRHGPDLLLVASPPREPWKGGGPAETLFLFRLLSLLGAEGLLLSAAGASLAGRIPAGTLAVAKDHLNFTGDRPLRHPASQEGAWPLFPDMTSAYPPDLREKVRALGRKAGREIPEVVYAGVPGPALPTPAEFLFYRNAGAQVISMSGPPWVEGAVQAGLKTVLLLAVTQEVDPDRPAPVDLESVLAAAESASGPLVETALALVKEAPGEGDSWEEEE